MHFDIITNLNYFTSIISTEKVYLHKEIIFISNKNYTFDYDFSCYPGAGLSLLTVVQLREKITATQVKMTVK